MDWKKFFIAFVAAFGFIFLFGFVWLRQADAWCKSGSADTLANRKPILVITSQRSFLGTL